MKVLISGASGLIGTELTKLLRSLGHEPVLLVRREKREAHEVSWNPANGDLEPGIMESVDAVVNLAGATTSKIPWTKKYAKTLVGSRIDSTRLLVQAINQAESPQRFFSPDQLRVFMATEGKPF